MKMCSLHVSLHTNSYDLKKKESLKVMLKKKILIDLQIN